METLNRYDEETGRRLKPSCPMCRQPFRGRDLPETDFINPVAAARRREILERVISEPAFALLPVSQRPIRLARELVVIRRSEHEAALNRLIEERDRIRASRASYRTLEEDQLRRQQTQPSTSDGQTVSQVHRRGYRWVMESDTSTASSQSSIQQPVISEEPSRSRSRSATPGQQDCSFHQSQDRSSQQPDPGPKSPVASSGSQQRDAAPILQPSDELRALNLRIHVAMMQLSQMSDESNAPIDLNQPDEGPLEPEWLPQFGEEELEPVAIIDNWARGRHMRYKIRWSDGTISLNRTREVETRAKELLENYRRELRRLATARTRERQRNGEAPKIPGRGRGRGRGPGSSSSRDTT